MSGSKSQLSRRQSRWDALQILYQMDKLRGADLQSVIAHFEKDFLEGQREVDQFTREIVEGALSHGTDLDEAIQKYASHWRISRMFPIDRTILRMGVFEFLYRLDIPLTVTLNEMVELAKMFGSENSASFVNGVLDSIAKNITVPGKAK